VRIISTDLTSITQIKYGLLNAMALFGAALVILSACVVVIWKKERFVGHHLILRPVKQALPTQFCKSVQMLQKSRVL